MFCMPLKHQFLLITVPNMKECHFEKEAFQKARIVNQPAFFRGYVVFQVGGTDFVSCLQISNFSATKT